MNDEERSRKGDEGYLSITGGKVLRSIVDIDAKVTTSIEGKGGVLQEGTSGSNQIGITVLKNLLSLLARGNRTNRDDGKTGNVLADTGGVVDLVTGGVGNLLEGGVSSRRDVDDIDSGVLGPLGDLDGLVDLEGGDVEVLDAI